MTPDASGPAPPDFSGPNFISVGGPVDRCSVTLRVFGDDLDPDAVSALLGAAPTDACRRGDIRPSRASRPIVEKRGRWSLGAESDGLDLDAAINRLLDGLTLDLSAWRELHVRSDADLFCGLFLFEWSRGLGLAPRTLGRLAERGLKLGLDIYYVGSHGAVGGSVE